MLEDNNNELVKHLVSEIDDASIWFWTDKSNYTNFIGALVTMFNQNAESIADRGPAGEVDFTQRVINLNPIEYSRDVSSVFAQSYTDKYNNGEYDGNTGNITLYDVYKMTVYGGDLTLGQNSVSYESRKEKLTEISPLTPIIIIPEKDKIPLVEAALDGYGFGNGAYIVPAIFLKYNADKIRNDYIEKGIVTTLDVATIAASGGTALATKVHWVRRAWAIMEVAGAVGDTTVNVANTSPEMKPAIDAYNMAMGVIGIKNVGKGIVNFAKELPTNVKTLLQENKSIRSLIAAKYLDYRIAITRLKNSDSWAELPADVRQQVVQQEKTFIVLSDAQNLPDNWGVSRSVFINGKTSEDILTITKGSRPLPETYLDAAYIQQHLAKFDDGIVRFTTKSNLRKYGTLGSDECFAMPVSEYNKLRIETGNDLYLIEKKLGLNPGDLTNDDAVIALIKRIDVGEIKIPSGNESGAIPELWLPGGKTTGGYSEAIIDLSNKNILYENLLK
ncbi:hypothetical protein FACS1894179_10820 [Bacteroidia bacterium]|nr:hypothetical protein FACS1894179_10820 [Bacteroidia bacterium]